MATGYFGNEKATDGSGVNASENHASAFACRVKAFLVFTRQQLKKSPLKAGIRDKQSGEPLWHAGRIGDLHVIGAGFRRRGVVVGIHPGACLVGNLAGATVQGWL